MSARQKEPRGNSRPTVGEVMRASITVVMLSSAAFAQQPRIDSLTPSQGPIAGGTIVTVKGTGMDGASFTFDGHAIAPLSVTDTEARVQVPAHANGFVVLTVTNHGAAAYGEYLYVPPKLTDIAPGAITTIAGAGNFIGDYRQATRAIVAPWGIVFDRFGNMYIAEATNDRVVRIRPDGVLEPFAGTGLIGHLRPTGTADARTVDISYPRGIAVDANGTLYVPDTEYYLWRITRDGVAQVIAGNGHEGFSGDGGPAAQATIGHPSYVAVDAGNNVYFLDATMARVRKIDGNGIINTVVGTGTFGFSGDGGPAKQAQFNIVFADMGGLLSDGPGNLYLLDYGNRRIRRIDAVTGIIETIVDRARAGSSLNDMRGMALDTAGNLYFSNAAELFKRSPDGTIARLNQGRGGFSPDGTLLSEAKLSGSRLAVTPDGRLVIGEGLRVRVVDSAGRLQTLAGVGPDRIDEGAPAAASVMASPNFDVAFLPTGELIFDDVDRIRKIDANGNVTTIAGIGTAGPVEDVPAIDASIAPISVEVASDGTIDFASGLFGALTIGRDGIVRRTAGEFAQCAFSGDGGDARNADFCQSFDATRDRGGNLLVADTNNNRVRRVDRQTGIINTIAGSGAPNGLEHYGEGKTCGDGGPATAACINTPYGLAVDDAGNIYVAQVDTPSGRIRKIDSTGTITTFALLSTSKLTWFHDYLYAVTGERVVRLSRDGAVTTLAGTEGVAGFGGDGGPATSAQITARKQSHGVAIDADGNLFFSDGDNRRIRAVRYGAVLPPPNASLQMTANGSTLRVFVTDASGRPAPSVRVDVSVPATGASCTLSNRFAITGPDGSASITCTSNCVEGSYAVNARPVSGSASASAGFTNSGGPCKRRSARH